MKYEDNVSAGIADAPPDNMYRHFQEQHNKVKEHFQEQHRRCQIPRAADFFFGYATPPHYKAFVPDGGSHYITELCRSLEDHSRYASLNTIMTVTNRAVGDCYISGQHREVAVFNSRARKDIFFF